MDSNEPSILFLTKYSRKGASSRYRTFQYIDYFKKSGINCTVSSLFDDNYLVYLYRLGRHRKLDVIKAFLRRIRSVLFVHQFDLVVIEKEVIPYFPAFLEWLIKLSGVPYIVDYDDALFHQYDNHRKGIVRFLLGSKIAHVMRGANLVVAGNAYLADYAKRAGARRIEIIPTVIDLMLYPEPAWGRPVNGTFTIGWIGSPSTSKYLELIYPALAEVCAGGRGRVLLIGADKVELPGVPVDSQPWSEATEVEIMNKMDVGIMPLPDEPWERGKCGFKLIQYMACGLPVVASPVGVNIDIVEAGKNGFLATDKSSWVKALCALRDNVELRHDMGRRGRQRVENEYSLQATAPRLMSLIKSVAEG